MVTEISSRKRKGNFSIAYYPRPSHLLSPSFSLTILVLLTYYPRPFHLLGPLARTSFHRPIPNYCEQATGNVRSFRRKKYRSVDRESIRNRLNRRARKTLNARISTVDRDIWMKQKESPTMYRFLSFFFLFSLKFTLYVSLSSYLLVIIWTGNSRVKKREVFSRNKTVNKSRTCGPMERETKTIPMSTTRRNIFPPLSSSIPSLFLPFFFPSLSLHSRAQVLHPRIHVFHVTQRIPPLVNLNLLTPGETAKGDLPNGFQFVQFKRIGTTCSTDFAAYIHGIYIFHYSYFPDFIFQRGASGEGGGPRLLFFIGPRIWRSRLYEIEIRTDGARSPVFIAPVIESNDFSEKSERECLT